MTEDVAGDIVARLLVHGDETATCHRVLSVPRAEPLALLRDLEAPLVAAWGAGSRVFSCWVHRGDGRLGIYVGGTRGFPLWQAGGTADRRAGQLLFPPGATSVPLGPAPALLSPEISAFPAWQRIGSYVDGHQEVDPSAVRVIEDVTAFVVAVPFVMLTIGVPVDRATVETLRRDDAGRLHESTLGIEQGRAGRVAESHAARLDESTSAVAGGLWRTHVFVGARTAEATAQLAALWCSGTRGGGTVRHRFAPVGPAGGLADVVGATTTASEAFEPAGPFNVGSTGLSWLCRPPVTEVPGVESRQMSSFDVETPRTDPGSSLYVGEVVGRSGTSVGDLRIPLSSVGKHMFVHGSTGAGKSQATRGLLTELSRQGIPWMVLEPAKSEYASGMQQRLAAVADDLPDPALAEVHVIRAGDPAATPVSINPLEPEPGFPYQVHLAVLTDLMIASFDAESPFPEVLTQAIERCVIDAGWEPGLSSIQEALRRIYPDGQPSYPQVDDLVRACHAVIDEKGYSREVAGNVRGFVDMRLATLLTGTKRAAFVDGYPLSMASVLGRNVVVEMQDLGTDADRALYMGLFLARMSQAVRLREAVDPARGRVRNVVCVEEAHRLLRNPEMLSKSAARAVESFTDLLAEVRSSGVALIVAEQIPSKISADVVKNTAVKCMGRTPAIDDRELVGGGMGLTAAQSEEVVWLAPGEFAVHSDGFDRPVKVRFPYDPEDRLGVEAADPAPLVAPMPVHMGSAARPGAATQRDLSLAGQLDRGAQLRFLCEAAVVALLAGIDMPATSPGIESTWFGGLDPVVDRVAVELAIGSAAAAAVKTRRTVLGAASPEAVTERAVAGLRAVLLEDRSLTPEPRWLSVVTQRKVMLDALRAVDDDGPPHPDTERWVQDWGVSWIRGGASPRAQRMLVAQHLLRVPRADEVAVLGTTSPSVLERLVAERSPSPADALRDLTRCLRPRTSRQALGLRIERAIRAREEHTRHAG